MKDKIFCLLIILVTLSNCNNNLKDNHCKTIRVNLGNSLGQLSQLEIEKMIPIESSPESYFGKVSKAMYFNDRYYFIDKFITKELYAFDGNGKFIKKTIKGKGPGEVISPVDFTLCKGESTRVMMYDQFGVNFIEFDRDLELIKEGPIMKELRLSNFDHIAADSFLVYRHTPTKVERENQFMNVYSIYTNNFTKKEELNISTVIGRGVVFLDNAIAREDNRLLFIAPYDYSIYELIGGNYHKKYQIDFGKHNLKQEDFLEMSYSKIVELENLGQKIGTLWSIFSNESFLIFGFNYKRDVTFILYSYKTERVYNLNENLIIHNVPLTRIVGVNEDGKLIGLMEPEDFLEFQNSNKKYDFNIKSEDNPLLILLDIRE